MKNDYDCIIIGGGAAGLMAAVALSKYDKRVIILEKNEKPGKKIYITGKGRCNVTNSCERHVFFDNVVNNSKFLFSAYNRFDSKSLCELIESSACKLKIERGNRVFPASDHSFDITKALIKLINKDRVEIRLNTKVCEILSENNQDESTGFLRKITGVKLSDKSVIYSDNIIIATGGASYPATGSTGDGYLFLKDLGHSIIKPTPALVPLTIKEDIYKDLQGVALKNISIKLIDIESKKKKPLFSGFGEMLFTHFGISGPLILSASSFLSRYKRKNEGSFRLYIDFKPAVDEETLICRLNKNLLENSNKSFVNAASDFLPRTLLLEVIKKSGINPDIKAKDINNKQRLEFVKVLKSFELNIVGDRGFNEAIITSGGINTKEINPATMQSKLIKGLFIAGELIDVDALTGGFNLQIAWSTGFLAGCSVGEE